MNSNEYVQTVGSISLYRDRVIKPPMCIFVEIRYGIRVASNYPLPLFSNFNVVRPLGIFICASAYILAYN